MKNPQSVLGLALLAASAVEAMPGNSLSALERRQTPGSTSSISNLRSKIKNIVVLVMENRSLDNILGGQTIEGLDNPINNGPFCNPYDLSDPEGDKYCSNASDYDSVLNDPNHAIYGNNVQFYGTFNPDNDAIASGDLTASMNGFMAEQLRKYDEDADVATLGEQVLNYYTEEQVPVLTELVQNYVTFNHWHSDIPGPTCPNRAALISGTSAGHGTNDADFGNGALTQRSIFQQLTEMNRTWANYYPTNGIKDALWFKWVIDSGNDDKVVSMSEFYDAAAAGTLPDFSYIDPSCCGVGTNSMHPSGLISDGQHYIKWIYDALRASPQWNQTLFFLTFDETGGFHDHVPPPLAVRPDNLTYTETTPDGDEYTFQFDRLGSRVPTFLISPWVGKGVVEQKGTNSDGDEVSYSASSLLRTLGYLWGFQPFTPRVDKAPSFDHLIQTTSRDDTPESMPYPNPFKTRPPGF